MGTSLIKFPCISLTFSLDLRKLLILFLFYVGAFTELFFIYSGVRGSGLRSSFNLDIKTALAFSVFYILSSCLSFVVLIMRSWNSGFSRSFSNFSFESSNALQFEEITFAVCHLLVDLNTTSYSPKWLPVEIEHRTTELPPFFISFFSSRRSSKLTFPSMMK